MSAISSELYVHSISADEIRKEISKEEYSGKVCINPCPAYGAIGVIFLEPKALAQFAKFLDEYKK